MYVKLFMDDDGSVAYILLYYGVCRSVEKGKTITALLLSLLSCKYK